MNMRNRPRRLRASETIRRLVRQTRMSPDSLIYPLFVREGNGVYEEISSLAGQFHYSPDTVTDGVARAMDQGVNSFMLFGIPSGKDEEGSGAWDADGVVQQALRRIKGENPAAFLITDVCLCEYTSHGHCGVLDDAGSVDNDATLPLLARTAVSHALAGADMVAPSDMMDGRVGMLRRSLDEEGLQNIPIMSYSVKFSSAFYGPFRDAAGSTPAFGDRRGYQMDFHNAREAVYEAMLDVGEGADILMVKPALAYLDIIAALRAQTLQPLAAYSVSGEYAMRKAAAAAGLIDGYAVMLESAAGIFRAGADMLITYDAPELAQAIRKGDIG